MVRTTIQDILYPLLTTSGNRHPLCLPPQLRLWRRKGNAPSPTFTHKTYQKPKLTHTPTRQSNYFKGSILMLTYLVIVVGFYLSGYAQNIEMMGVDRFDRLAIGRETFKTVGRGRSGRAY